MNIVVDGYAQTATVLERGNIFFKSEFKACHASTIVQLNKQALMAAWFGGDHEGAADVCIWASTKKTKGWAAPVKIADGKEPDGKTYACWNPVLFKAKNGKLYLHYKVGPNPREWWAMYKVSADDGKTWSKAIKLPGGFLGPIKNKPVSLKNGEILYPSSVESMDEKHWSVHLERSDAAVSKWEKIAIDVDTFQVIQPSILFYPDNRLQLLARSKANVIVQSWSGDGGQHWSELSVTGVPNPNSGIDAVTTDKGLQLLVYNPLKAGKNWWEGRSVLKLAASTDGANWKDIYTFEDQKSGEYSYPAIICGSNGLIHVTYTSNRKNITYVKIKLKAGI